MAGYATGTRRTSLESLKIDPAERPGWVAGNERLPDVGEEVHCTEGVGEVVRILGKTSDGSRLLELTLPDRPKQPFFVAASNVLVKESAQS